jgi:hypothetical protein
MVDGRWTMGVMGERGEGVTIGATRIGPFYWGPCAAGDSHVVRFSLITINRMSKRWLIRQRRPRPPWFNCFLVRDLRFAIV